ncbi:YhcN/YlaJ family sporulation lipoprotein [Psychrobacillus sp.]|uniref:YhcN/YlaJ family sporulation lipoprotein n=1 Tax=Psychrobacillus sp. TaxID=1871623 RepID=UPI0028BE53DE|nr:YhcN/YlaJ family sporulation lipoprotein [Psychrobacillus sp.]
MKKKLYVLVMFLLLTGCSDASKDTVYDAKQTKEAQEVESELDNYSDVMAYTSVLEGNDVIVSIDIQRLKRFNKEKIENKVKKYLEEKLPGKEIIVTADIKIKWELAKIIDHQLQGEELNQAIENIKSLSKEET